jgi:hypothetical protein
VQYLQLFLFGGGMVAQIYAGTHGALGRHQDTVTLEELHVYGKMRLVQGLLMTVTSICLLKFSIAMSLLRLNAKRWYKRILWALVSMTSLSLPSSPGKLISYVNSFYYVLYDRKLGITTCLLQSDQSPLG